MYKDRQKIQNRNPYMNTKKETLVAFIIILYVTKPAIRNENSNTSVFFYKYDSCLSQIEGTNAMLQILWNAGTVL